MSLAERDLVEEERAKQRLRDAALARDTVHPSGLDQGTRRLALIAGGLGGLLVVVVGGWSLLGHRHAGGIPVIEPAPGPVRVKPVDPGGMQLMSTQVAQTNGPGAQALAPGPEQAAPQALQAEVDAARHADAPPPPPSPHAEAPRSPAQATGPVQPPEPAVIPEAGDAGSPAGGQAAQTVAALTSDVSSPRSAAPAAGHQAVQLGALESDALARAEWAQLSKRAPGLFAHREPVIVRITRGDKQFFRLRTAGFASADDADKFCAQAKAKGIACTRADF